MTLRERVGGGEGVGDESGTLVAGDGRIPATIGGERDEDCAGQQSTRQMAAGTDCSPA